MKRALVTGAGGFIGHHLVSRLKAEGWWVRGVDIKFPLYESSLADEFLLLDLRELENAKIATNDINIVFALAADMGGMGYISAHHSIILRGNFLINSNTLEAAVQNSCETFFFASSACVYPEYRQEITDIAPLKETDAYPAYPQDAYGWEKLLAERLCAYYAHDYKIGIRVARFHNIYGPKGTWEGGREKAPAAICRKIAEAKLNNQSEIAIWGDGNQTRSFCYIDDCIEGILRLVQSNYMEPINLGQDHMVSINELVQLISSIADYPVHIVHEVGPEGVRGRNSDNSLIKATLNWVPRVSLEEGLRINYRWIEEQLRIKCAEVVKS